MALYKLETDTLEAIARKLLSEQTLPEVAKDLDRQADDRKILKDDLAEDGTMAQWPPSRCKLDGFLHYLAEPFEFPRTYPEKEVDAVIGAFIPDISGLRRDLISARHLARERDGSAYWRVTQPKSVL